MAFEIFRAPFAGSELYGSKPDIPDAPTSTEILALALGANLKNLPAATELAGKATQANFDLIRQMFEQVPGYKDLESGILKEIKSQQAGEIPDAVRKYIQNDAAAGALEGGFSGGGLGSSLYGMGLVKEGIRRTEKGLESAQKWLAGVASFYQPGVFDIRSMFVSPQQQQSISEFGFQRDLMKAKLDAAPDPVRAGRLAYETWMLGSYLGSGQFNNPSQQPPPSTTPQQPPGGGGGMGGWGGMSAGAQNASMTGIGSIGGGSFGSI